MNAIAIYEILVVLIILSRLIMLRIKYWDRHRAVRFACWFLTALSCIILLRLTDNQIETNTRQLAMLVFIALVLWMDLIFGDKEGAQNG